MASLNFVFNFILFVSIPSISYLLMKNYPKEKNDVIGYRTKRSMASPEAWLFANGYFSRLLFRFSLVTVSLQAIFFFAVDAHFALLFSAGFWVIVLIGLLIKTEWMLKGQFNHKLK